ncbi:MAG: CHAT domain-containing protein [Cyclobacteriaceae bacterium]
MSYPRKALIVFLLASTVVITVANGFPYVIKSTAIEDPYAKAKTLFENQDYTGCISYINQLSPVPGTDLLQLQCLLGMAYFENREFDEAITAINSVADRVPSAPAEKAQLFNACQTLSEIYWNRQNYDSATIWNRKAADIIDFRPEFAYLRPIDDFQKAKLAFGIRPNEVKTLLRKVAVSFDRSDKRVLDLYTILAYSVFSEGKRDSAFVWLNEGLSLFQERFKTDTLRLINLQLQKAYLQYESYDLESSLKTYEEEVAPLIFKKHDKNHKRYEFQQGEFYRLAIPAYSLAGDFDQCIRYGKGFLAVAPSFIDSGHVRYGEVYRDLADNYLKLNRVASYVEYMTKAIAIFNESPFYKTYVPLYQAKSNYHAKLYAKSLQWCDTILSQIPGGSYNGYIETVNYIRLQNLIQLSDYKALHTAADSVISLLTRKYDYPLKDLLSYRLFKIVAWEKARLDLKEPEGQDSAHYANVSHQLNHYYESVISRLDRLEEDGLTDQAEIYCLYAYHLIRNSELKDVLYYIGKAELINSDSEGKGRVKSELVRSLSYYYKGLYYRERYKKSGEIVHLQKALEILLEGDRFNRGNPDSRGTVSDKLEQISDFLPRYKDDLMLTLQELYELDGSSKYAEIAFELMEQRKSALMLESQKTREMSYLLDVPDSLILRAHSLRQQIGYLNDRLSILSSETNNNVLINSFQHFLEQAKEEKKLLNSYLRKVYPDYYTISDSGQYIAMTDVKDQLSDKEALFHFYHGKYHHFILAFTKDQHHFARIEALQEATVRKFRLSLDPAEVNKDPYKAYQDFTQTAVEIYNSQLSIAMAAFPDIRKVYVMPDGQLHHVPLETLLFISPDKDSFSFKNLDYLINEYTFSYAYSATTLFEAEELPAGKTGGNLLAMAPAYGESTCEEMLKEDVIIPGKLLWNQWEINQLQDNYRGHYKSGGEATKAYFYDVYQNYRIIHLAMHATVDENQPMYSHMIFSPTGDKAQSLLRAFEIFKMNFQAEMIVLSACNSGDGKIYTGEGAMSLAKAFSYAGCQSVVMSYWPADDKASGLIMSEFYSNLSAGNRKDEALRKAKLAYFENADQQSAAPAFWNNFVVSGNVRPLSVIKNQQYPWLILIGVAIVCLIVVLLYVNFNQQRS